METTTKKDPNLGEGGRMDILWTKAYNGSKLEYVDQNIYCYLSGKNIVVSGETRPFVFPGEGVSAIAVHKFKNHIAIGARGLDPEIYIYELPTFKIFTILPSCAKLEYCSLAFSSSDYLACLSGVPNFQLVIWNYKTCTELCSLKMPKEVPLSITINPGNWQQLGVIYTNKIYYCYIIKCHTYQELHCNVIVCPPYEGKQNGDVFLKKIPHINTVYECLNLTEAAKAGQVGQRAKELENLIGNVNYLNPLCQDWSPLGSLYIGCKQGHILKIVPESNTLTVVFNPSDYKQNPEAEGEKQEEPTEEGGKGEEKEGEEQGKKEEEEEEGKKGEEGKEEGEGKNEEEVKEGEKEGEGEKEAKEGEGDGDGEEGEKEKEEKEEKVEEEEEEKLKEEEKEEEEEEDSMDFIVIHQNTLTAASKNGKIRQFDLKEEILKADCEYNASISISSLTLTLDQKKVLIGSSQGIIELHDLYDLDQFEILYNESSSSFIDVKCLYPGTDTAATIQSNGLLQLWKINDGTKLSSLLLKNTLCSLSCSPISYLLAVGCASGHVCIIDVIIVLEPRVIYCLQLCNSPINIIHFDYNGDFLFSVSENDHIFIQDGSGSSLFSVYGFLSINYHVKNLTTDTFKDVDVYIIAETKTFNTDDRTDKLCIFQLEADFKTNYKEKYASPECDFDPFKVNFKLYSLLSAVQGLMAFHGEAYVHSEKSHTLIQLPLNDEMPTEIVENMSEVLFAQNSYECHQLTGIDVHCSEDQNWLISSGRDGTIQLSFTNDIGRSIIQYASHDIYGSCIKSVCLTSDCYHVLVTSEDGTVSCYKITYTSNEALSRIEETKEWLHNKKELTQSLVVLETRAINKISTIEPFEDEDTIEKTDQVKESTTEESTESSSPDLRSPPNKGSWFQIQKAKHLHEKNLQYASAKKHIRDSIKRMRATVRKMLNINEKLPEIERLERYEFDLDVEEQTRLQQEAKDAVLQVYERIELENLSKLFLKSIIKAECFDKMKVKGRTLKAFLIPLEVTNFPLLERSPKALNTLQIFQKRRKIEMQVDDINKEIMEDLLKPAVSPTDSQLSEDYSEELSRVPSNSEQCAGIETETVLREEEEKEKQEEEEAPVVRQETPSTHGSLGILYGGGSEFLYNQLHLHSRYQKIVQIILLQDVIYRIKETFNKEFDELYQRKESEITRIKEKNKRIAEIIRDLAIDEEMFNPDMGVHEKPELLLIVQDSEVKTEKYLSPEQRKALEEKLAEEERRKREKSDNVRERALLQMMNGVLEIRKEDELKKDIPIPPCASKEEEWTEEEIKIMKEYERKVKELNEEREKYRKNLETELKKMQSSIVESMSNFDDLLNNLFQKHIQVIKTIRQEELKISRIKLNLMIQNVLDCQEKELLLAKESKIEEQNELDNVLVLSERLITDFRFTYDQILMEDKVMEKSFKNEFVGISQQMVETLHKLFKKRPKIYKMKRSESHLSADMNPASSSLGDQQGANAQKNSIESTLEEMDRFNHMPEGLDPKIWMKFCQFRRNKVYKEQQVRNAALTLAEMNAFHQDKMENQEKLNKEVSNIEAEIKKLKRNRQQFEINIEIQLLLKQGQVEMETDSFIYNFNESVLIHRCIIEELNSKIKDLAEQKIASMEESKDFKKGIFQQEWEHRKMMMEMEDLRQKIMNIRYLKVTREVQEYLMNYEYDAKKLVETEQLEKSVAGLKEIHRRKLKKINEDIDKLRLQVFHKQKENENLVKQIEVLNVEVNDRHHIMDVSAEKREYLHVEKKYHTIKQRKRMVDLAKSQAAELAVLRKEVERLRMKTFPALL